MQICVGCLHLVSWFRYLPSTNLDLEPQKDVLGGSLLCKINICQSFVLFLSLEKDVLLFL